MYRFRRNLNLNQATVRLATAEDLPRVARLLLEAARHYHGLTAHELPDLMNTMPVTVIETGSELWAVVIPGWPVQQTTWLRGVALVRGLDISAGLGLLLPTLHSALRVEGIVAIYYAGTEAADVWLIPALQRNGYVRDTEVIVYEKVSLRIPSMGNSRVRIRAGLPEDLEIVSRLDRDCFEAHWTKEETMMRNSLAQGPFFIIAELDKQIVGYAYATSHFGGRIVHLVRIAVDPHQQGKLIGVRLLAEVVTFARRLNADAVTLNTQEYNTQAQRLYKWFGFVATPERQLILRYDLSMGT